MSLKIMQTNKLTFKRFMGVMALSSLSLLLPNTCFAGATSSTQIYHFTPLPMKDTKELTKDFLPLVTMLEEKLNLNIEFALKKNYEDILQNIMEKKIDIAVLGPLPFIKLNAMYPDMEPIVFFKRKNGGVHYKCVLSKFIGEELDTSKPLKVALTQPLSTCGYYQTRVLLEQKYGLALSEQLYRYTNSHTSAVKSVIEGTFDMAGSSDTYARDFQNLGIEVVAESEWMPGFAIYANKKTVPEKVIKDIQELMLSIDAETFKQWGGRLKHGVAKPTGEEFKKLSVDVDIPLQGNF